MTTERPASSHPVTEPEAAPRPKHLPLLKPRPTEAPPVIPARMLNEVMYCERLMYLEWVHGEFADNYFTVDGRYVHQRADAPGGKIATPPSATKDAGDDAGDDLGVTDADAAQAAEEPRPYQARSVWLTSEALGISAKVDIVETQVDGGVIAVEYKRGRAPDLPERAYLPERVQVCAQVLLLRDQGYRCDNAEIYFAKSRQRVPIELSQELIRHTHWAIRIAREVACSAEPPAPLVDSPKCRGCSLVGICLPDEVNLLKRVDGQPIIDPQEPEDDLRGPLEPDPWGLVGAHGEPSVEPTPVRRLYAARDDRVPVYVQDHGAQIGVSGERLVVRQEGGAHHVRLMNTAHVVVRGNVQLSTQATRALLDRGIPIAFLSSGGWFSGRISGTDTKNIDLRIAQYRAALDPERCVALARDFIVAKMRNARTMLRRNHERLDPVVVGQLKQLTRKARECETLESLLGLEGAAARVYFQNFTGMFKAQTLGSFDFQTRNRRPPKDPVNALLSFAYALLTKDLVFTAAQVGLEPLLGFYHQPRFGRPALALDLMEEFRPIIGDSVVLSVINNGIVGPDDFVRLASACSLKEHARKRFIEAYERRMDQTITHPIFGYTVSYRRVLEIQARLLSRVLLGELATYPAFITR